LLSIIGGKITQNDISVGRLMTVVVTVVSVRVSNDDDDTADGEDV